MQHDEHHRALLDAQDDGASSSSSERATIPVTATTTVDYDKSDDPTHTATATTTTTTTTTPTTQPTTGNEEQQRLLDNDNDPEREHDHRSSWEMEVQEPDQPVYLSKWENPMWRYPVVAAFFVMFFLLFKMVMLIAVQRHTQHRRPDRIFYNGTEYFGPTLIMISLDGFRPDYLERNMTPNMVNFAASGMRAEYMHPSFPSITAPNHWTLATGLYPEAHGIVANEFYDPDMNKAFFLSNDTVTHDHRWWHGEPIWHTAQRQEKRSGVIMWPGSNVKELAADYVVPFNNSISARAKMDTVLQWIDLPVEERPHLVSVYIQQTDQEGHHSGPDSPVLNEVLKTTDEAIGYLLEELNERRILDRIHIVIVSDHGMAETHRSRVIYYDDILSKTSMSWLREREAGPLLGLRPKDNAPKHAVEQIYQELHNYTQHHPNDAHFQVYLREHVPNRFHYNDNNRIPPVVAIPDVGYAMVSHEEWDPKDDKEPFTPRGIHGYDNLADDMQSIFLAHGPTVDLEYGRQSILAPFFNTEVYSFLCHLLNIDPAPNNGTLEGRFLRIR